MSVIWVFVDIAYKQLNSVPFISACLFQAVKQPNTGFVFIHVYLIVTFVFFCFNFMVQAN
jgi:hypothetical protein